MSEDFGSLEASFYDAMQRNDATALGQLMDDECIYLHSFGSRDSKASYLEKVRAGHFVYRDIKFTQDKILRRGDVAIIIGTMSGVVTANGFERVLNNVRTSVWVKGAVDWQLLSFQPTPWLDR